MGGLAESAGAAHVLLHWYRVVMALLTESWLAKGLTLLHRHLTSLVEGLTRTEKVASGLRFDC